MAGVFEGGEFVAMEAVLVSEEVDQDGGGGDGEDGEGGGAGVVVGVI